MIEIREGMACLHTRNTSYILGTGREGLAENLYYGGRIEAEDPLPLQIKADAGYGGDVLRPGRKLALSNLCLELSPVERGDYRRPALLAEGAHGLCRDFCLEGVRQTPGPAPTGGMPAGRGGDGVLALSFAEPSGLFVELFYTLFYGADVITKRMRISNRGDAPVKLLRAHSNQLDLPGDGYVMHTLQGSWAREFGLERGETGPGIRLFGSGTGASGHRCNPFFFLARPGTGELCGDVYGFNLVYSGSHEASVEVDPMGRTRVLQGIWSDGFAWRLAPGESFVTPEAVLTFSEKGFTGMSHNMHRFVKDHILPPAWRGKPRPVLLNNWEGTYFDFTESKIVAMARAAKNLGVELFVLDDGWFGRRDSDAAGLGDYDVNRKKLPSGLGGLARKLRGMGLDFGLWFEPEMASRDSRLFEEHPDWIVAAPGYAPCEGRNQYLLDITRPEVRDYIVGSMGGVLDAAPITYVKWDMNRHMSEKYSPGLPCQGEFAHRYALGLYELFDRVCAARPHILFEGCASGGNRFDLGVLYYMPQIWTSDDTDAVERQRIQTGASYGYPQCTMGCHVSAVPNHQTLRRAPLETRFQTAAFGVLGYELDARTLSRAERADIAAQIAFYKANRELLQYGDFYRLKNPFEGNGCGWMVVAGDRSRAIAGDFTGLVRPNTPAPPLRLAGLDFGKRYKIGVRPLQMDIHTFGGLINHVLPLHLNPDGVVLKVAGKFYRMDTESESYTACGGLLCRAGLQRLQNFSGGGYSESMRLLEDFASRLYVLETCEGPGGD